MKKILDSEIIALFKRYLNPVLYSRYVDQTSNDEQYPTQKLSMYDLKLILTQYFERYLVSHKWFHKVPSVDELAFNNDFVKYTTDGLNLVDEHWQDAFNCKTVLDLQKSMAENLPNAQIDEQTIRHDFKLMKQIHKTYEDISANLIEQHNAKLETQGINPNNDVPTIK